MRYRPRGVVGQRHHAGFPDRNGKRGSRVRSSKRDREDPRSRQDMPGGDADHIPRHQGPFRENAVFLPPRAVHLGNVLFGGRHGPRRRRADRIQLRAVVRPGVGFARDLFLRNGFRDQEPRGPSCQGLHIHAGQGARVRRRARRALSRKLRRHGVHGPHDEVGPGHRGGLGPQKQPRSDILQLQRRRAHGRGHSQGRQGCLSERHRRQSQRD